MGETTGSLPYVFRSCAFLVVRSLFIPASQVLCEWNEKQLLPSRIFITLFFISSSSNPPRHQRMPYSWILLPCPVPYVHGIGSLAPFGVRYVRYEHAHASWELRKLYLGVWRMTILFHFCVPRWFIFYHVIYQDSNRGDSDFCRLLFAFMTHAPPNRDSGAPGYRVTCRSGPHVVQGSGAGPSCGVVPFREEKEKPLRRSAEAYITWQSRSRRSPSEDEDHHRWAEYECHPRAIRNGPA